MCVSCDTSLLKAESSVFQSVSATLLTSSDACFRTVELTAAATLQKLKPLLLGLSLTLASSGVSNVATSEAVWHACW
jgi:hypothetical protein